MAEKKAAPLIEQDGYRQPGLEQQMMEYLAIDEHLNGRIITWLAPPFSIEYPTVKRGVQNHVQVAVSDKGLNIWRLQTVGNAYAVAEHNHFEYGTFNGLQARETVRVVKPRGSWRARNEQVVLAKFWAGGDNPALMMESRYKQAGDQVRALRDGMLAAESRLKAAQGETDAAAVEKTGMVDDLTRLEALYREGALSPTEWEQAKTALIAQRPDRRSRALSALDQLHGLYRAGALTEHEFQRKKLELLTW